MAWDDAPPTPQELSAAPKWDATPPTPAELGQEGPGIGRQIERAVVDTIPMVGGVLGGIAGTPADIVSGPAGTVLGAAGGYMGGKAVRNTINSFIDPEMAPKTLGESVKDIALGAPEGVVQEVGGQIIGKGVGLAAQKAGQMAPELAGYLAGKMGKVANNIPEEYTKEYLARQGAIEARPANEIMDELSGHYNESQTKLNDAKSAVETAKDAAASTKEGLNADFADERFQAAHDMGEAKANLEAAHEAQLQKLRDVKSPIDLADDVQESISDLKQQIRKGSKESYDILDRDPNAYSVRGGAQILRQMADEMNIQPYNAPGAPEGAVFKSGYAGQTPEMAGLNVPKSGPVGQPSAPVTAESAAVQGALRSFADRLEATPELVPARELKKMLQQIDNSERAQYGQVGFDSRVSQAYKQIRATIDNVIKTENPEYAAKMQEVAQKTGLLDQAAQTFSSPQATISKLNTAGGQTAGPTRQVLDQLGQATGKDLSSPVDEYMQAQSTLKNPQAVQSMKESLPEFQAHQAAAQKVQRLANPATRRALSEAPEMAAANNNLGAAQSTLDQAADRAQQLRSLNPQTVQAKVKALTGARNYGAENTFADVDAATGKQYSKEIKDRAILDSFQKSDTQGSRKTVLGGAIGGAVGMLAGHNPTATALGISAGSAIGQAADKYAGQAFKAALDTGIGISKFSKALGPYAKVLTDAAARGGPQAVAASHYILQQKDENYRKRVDAINSAGQ